MIQFTYMYGLIGIMHMVNVLILDLAEIMTPFMFTTNGCMLLCTGFRTSEELLQYIAHFFYNGKRPSSLQTLTSSESLKSVA
jgi:hypothetical protein